MMQPEVVGDVCRTRSAVTWIRRSDSSEEEKQTAVEADSEAAGTLPGVGNSRRAPLNRRGFVNIRRSGKDKNALKSREFLHRSVRPHLPPCLGPSVFQVPVLLLPDLQFCILLCKTRRTCRTSA